MQVSPEIESLVPYKPGKPIEETKRELGLSEVIKLASNENPLGPSPKAVDAIKNHAENLSRYPDPSCFRLREALSQKWQVRSDDIVIGNGSNELIDLLIRTFCEPGDKIIFPDKSFIAYGICAQAARVGKKVIPIDRNFQWDADAFLEDFEKNHSSREKILFLANPNNPTGTYLGKEKIDKILDKLGGRKDILIVLDEAYNEFVRADDYVESLDYFKKYENVLVMRTFSKVYGLAGLRVGALVGSQKHLQWVNRVRNPFNVNTLAQEAAIAAFGDSDYLTRSQEVVWKGLDDFYAFFEQEKIPFVRSQANFLLFDSLRDGQNFFNHNMKKGLLVRPLAGYGLPRHIRLSVGTEEENKKAIEILRKSFEEVAPL